jgi:hypothetical protein
LTFGSRFILILCKLCCLLLFVNIAAASGECCKKVRITGTTNKDEFYQEIMGDFEIYQKYSQLDYTNNPVVKHDFAKGSFPVYSHEMFVNDPDTTDKFAYLYFYYNLEPRNDEIECPEGCWIISK